MIDSYLAGLNVGRIVALSRRLFDGLFSLLDEFRQGVADAERNS